MAVEWRSKHDRLSLIDGEGGIDGEGEFDGEGEKERKVRAEDYTSRVWTAVSATATAARAQAARTIQASVTVTGYLTGTRDGRAGFSTRVSHAVTTIAFPISLTQRYVSPQPAAARDAMAAVETASRETLAGLRRMLGALRVAEAAPLDPPPSLADLDRLAAATTAAGVLVDVRWLGERRPVPAEIDLSAFRIVQESVTNVVRHAGTRSCRVTITQSEDEMSIEVEDDGSGPHQSSNTIGYGIAGMRERVGLLHGDFSAGARPEGGFRVWARLPVPVGVR
jgi:signal transduction histidine kinase